MKSRLQFDHECLRIETEKGVSDRLEWASVLEVFAFKDDVFGTDIICIGFRTDDMGFHWKIDGEYEGYKDLVVFLPEVFPGIRTDWFSDVAFPAFASCLTSLWGEQRIAAIWETEKTPRTGELSDDPWGLDPGVSPKSLAGALFQAVARMFRSK